ncbi:hypothetical protein GGU11DRAFT_750258 [Lentinula aff. detonsa]|nr:hypothetical protein GGU11DRAFT_750258 [Lentinula aff. detonsa]
MNSSLLVSILLSTSVTYAMPTNVSALDTRGFFDKLTGNDIIIGYRWVNQNQAAAEINRYGTLRAIPAMDEEKELLEGAYLSPSLDLRSDGLPSDYWECKITANDKLFLKRPMLFISDVEKVKRNTAAITNYISAHGMSNTDIPKTIFFSEHRYTVSISHAGEQTVSVSGRNVTSSDVRYVSPATLNGENGPFLGGRRISSERALSGHPTPATCVSFVSYIDDGFHSNCTRNSGHYTALRCSRSSNIGSMDVLPSSTPGTATPFLWTKHRARWPARAATIDADECLSFFHMMTAPGSTVIVVRDEWSTISDLEQHIAVLQKEVERRDVVLQKARDDSNKKQQELDKHIEQNWVPKAVTNVQTKHDHSYRLLRQTSVQLMRCQRQLKIPVSLTFVNHKLKGCSPNEITATVGEASTMLLEELLVSKETHKQVVAKLNERVALLEDGLANLDNGHAQLVLSSGVEYDKNERGYGWSSIDLASL